jgi:hypothetical protein
MRHRAAALCLLVFTACASGSGGVFLGADPKPLHAPAPVPINRPDAATLTIYRLPQSMASRRRPTVTVDGKELLKIGNGKVYTGYFAPGTYEIRMEGRRSGGSFDLEAGKVYYLRVDVVTESLALRWSLMQVTPTRGSAEVQGLEPVPPAQIADKSHSGAG